MVKQLGVIWFVLTACSLVLTLFTSPQNALTAFSSAGEKAVTFTITMCGINAVWLGLINIVNESGLINKLKKPLKPIVTFLFGKQSAKTQDYLIQNISANLLGMGNACTPSGMKAMESMDDKTGTITYAMMMLMILNSTSVQIIPTTTIGLRSLYKSSAPASIILPCFLSSLFATLVGVFLVKLLWKRREKKGLKKWVPMFSL